jgi:2-phospho-L-lactate guanylyltransferase
MIRVAVPVKDLASAKQRLAGALTREQRHALARAMLEDVLDVLEGALPGATRLVTRDAEVMALARGRGIPCLVEDANRGHTEAVAFAQADAVREGARAFVTIPGDVPCVTAREIGDLLAAGADEPTVALVPSLSGFGTNAALLAPPSAMPLKFGEPSFDNHLLAARQRGLHPRVLRLPGLGLDVDTREDLDLLLSRGPATRSARMVAAFRSGAP